MLRKTVARAFGADSEEAVGRRGSSRAAARKDPGPFPSAVEKLLRDLQRELERRSGGEGTGQAPFTVSKPRSLPDGVGIVIDGKGASIRLVDTLSGCLRVILEAPSAAAEEVLSVELRGGAYQPVRKLAAPPPGLARTRAAFEFTTVYDLAERYALAASDGARARDLCERAARS